MIELLVVISIIAVLMAILMPALGKVRKMAQRTVGLTNQRSIGIALNLYVLDNDNRFSHGKGGSIESKAADVSWIRDVAAYTDKAANIFVCPSAKKPSQNTALTQGYGTSDEAWRWDWGANNSEAQERLRKEIGLTIGHPIGYSYNAWASNPDPASTAAQNGHFGQPGWKTSYCWKSPSQISDNANTPIIGDGRWMYAYVNDDDVPQATEDEEWLYNQDRWGLNMFMIDRHGGPSINMLFADNSARSVELKDLMRLKWHKEYDVSNVYVTEPDRLPDWLK